MKTMRHLIVLAAAGTLSFSQNPLSTSGKTFFDGVAHNVVAAAEKMPEDNYSFKPTPDVRSFGELVSHTVDAQNHICSAAAGEKSAPDISKIKTSKADLVQAEKDAVAYCDKVWGTLTDDQAAQLVKLGGREMPKLTVLSYNTVHLNEHYGNMVTYMRLKGLVPPSSEPKK